MHRIAPLVIGLFWGLLHPTVLLERGVVAAQRTSESRDSRALIKITQELLDDIAVGDRSRWSKYLANDCVVTGDDGRTLTKEQFLTELQPLPKGYSGKIELDKPLVRSSDGVVVISYDLHEQENVFGQSLRVEYHTTDTWLLRGKEWQLMASQSLRKFADPPQGPINPARYADYIGLMNWQPALPTRFPRKAPSCLASAPEGTRKSCYQKRLTLSLERASLAGEFSFGTQTEE